MLSKESLYNLLFDPRGHKKKRFRAEIKNDASPLENALSLFFEFGSQQKLLFHFKDDDEISLALGCASETNDRLKLKDLPRPSFGGLAFNLSKDPSSLWQDFPSDYFFHPKMLVIFKKKGLIEIKLFAPKKELRDVFNLDPIPKDEDLSVSAIKEEPHWEERIEKGIESVRTSRRLKKIVLSSYAQLEVSSVRNYIETLFKKNASCHHFLFSKNQSLLFSFSPETLLHIRGLRLSTVAMAGSVSLDEDESLLFSEKILDENERVVLYIKETLSDFVDELRLSKQKIAKLHNIKHLYRNISAKMKARCDPIELLLRLHPTPALCGYPKDESMSAVEENEPFKRMWYAGALGMLGENQLRFIAGIRLGIVLGGKVRLYAGAGLTKDSVLEQECKEIRKKMLFGQR